MGGWTVLSLAKIVSDCCQHLSSEQEILFHLGSVYTVEVPDTCTRFDLRILQSSFLPGGSRKSSTFGSLST